MELVVMLMTWPDSLPREEPSHFGFSAYVDVEPGEWRVITLDLAALELGMEGDKAYRKAGEPTRIQDLSGIRFVTSQRNIAIGVVSAVVDNIPVMFSVLAMNPTHMDDFQWLLITLAAGVGGSMLSIGSAAGVGLMGVAHGRYTFMSHLKWTPVIALGYAAGIATHFAFP